MLEAQQKKNGNYEVLDCQLLSKDRVIALIVKTSLGWRVMSRTSARKNSRTHSASPELAARKYFKDRIFWQHLEQSHAGEPSIELDNTKETCPCCGLLARIHAIAMNTKGEPILDWHCGVL